MPLLSVESSLPSFRDVSDLCLDVSLGTWGADPFMYQLLRYRIGHFRSEKSDSRVQKCVKLRRPKRDVEMQPICGPQTWQRGLSA